MENNITKWIKEASTEDLHTMTNSFLCEYYPALDFCENNSRPTCAEAFRDWSLKEE